MIQPRSTLVASAAGFTLLEMLVALAILGLLAALTLPILVKPSDGFRLRTAANDLITALRLARTGAILRQAEMVVVIDLEQRTMESPMMPMKRLPPDIAADMRIAAPERATASRGGFRFFPDGSSTGGDVRLRAGGREARICVSWLTGQAREGGEC
jgi:general secretion pathway protein H